MDEQNNNMYSNGTNGNNGTNPPVENNPQQQYNQPVGNNNPQQQYYQPPGNSNPQQQYYQPPGNNNPQQQYYQPPMNNQGMPSPQPPKKKSKVGKVIGIILGIIVFIFVALFIIGLFVEDEETLDTGTSQTQQAGEVQEQPSSEEDNEEAKELAAGVISGDSYSNDFAGLGITLPDSQWTFLDNDSIYEMLADSSPMRDENGGVYIESDAEVAHYDLMMLNNANGTNIQVMLSETSGMAGVITSEELFLSNASSGLGDSATVSDPYDITIADETYKAVDVNYADYGSMQTIATRKIGSDFVCVIVTVYSDMDTNSCSYYTDMFFKP